MTPSEQMDWPWQENEKRRVASLQRHIFVFLKHQCKGGLRRVSQTKQERGGFVRVYLYLLVIFFSPFLFLCDTNGPLRAAYTGDDRAPTPGKKRRSTFLDPELLKRRCVWRAQMKQKNYGTCVQLNTSFRVHRCPPPLGARTAVNQSMIKKKALQ